MSGLTRRCVIPVPAGAKPGHTLTVQTDAGLFQLAVPAKFARLFVADLPVPEGCALPHLTVAWVRVGGADAPDAPCEKPPRSFHADHALDRGEEEDAASEEDEVTYKDVRARVEKAVGGEVKSQK